MKGKEVVERFVAMRYERRGTNASSGNWRADFNKGMPELRLFGNRIAWLKVQWGDTHDLIETSNCGWNTRTTNKGLSWVMRYVDSARFRQQQHMVFEENYDG